MAHYKILNDDEIRSALADLPDWSLKAPNIEATFASRRFATRSPSSSRSRSRPK